MLSALIPPVGRKPAVPLAGQLAHESYVRPGPLVLGTAFLRSPTAASDRDRHRCYHQHATCVPGARAFLPGSACRHADRTISSPCALEAQGLGVWSLRILDCEGAMEAPIPTTSIHPEGLGGKPIEASRAQVHPRLHFPNHTGEGEELLLLAAHERISFEERDHPTKEIPAAARPARTCGHAITDGPHEALRSRSAPAPGATPGDEQRPGSHGTPARVANRPSCRGSAAARRGNILLRRRNPRRRRPAFPADQPHLSHCHCSLRPCPPTTKRVYHDLQRASSAGYNGLSSI